MSDILGLGLETTAIGMGVTFMVLVGLWGLMSLSGRLLAKTAADEPSSAIERRRMRAGAGALRIDADAVDEETAVVISAVLAELGITSGRIAVRRI